MLRPHHPTYGGRTRSRGHGSIDDEHALLSSMHQCAVYVEPLTA